MAHGILIEGPGDPTENQAYCMTIIDCDVAGCYETFEDSLNEPATNPVEDWAADMTLRARKAGWSSNDDGQVLCPNHRGDRAVS
jgi:hypothetical protein